MPKIIINKLNFIYEGFYEPIFVDLSAELDSSWKLGLVGRNGMGKTTLLRLLTGELPAEGAISAQVAFDYFPPLVQEKETTLQAIRALIADFDGMEQEILACAASAANDREALQRYGELQQYYQQLDGYIIDELIEAEVGRLGVTAEALQRPFATLSGGERTKVMLAALFLKKDNFLLIDEPTDHLDLEGRRAVASYLSSKKGFILVSHDRRFLDAIIDHVLVLEKKRVTLRQGSFSAYLEDKQREDAAELERNERLQQQISSLERSARQKRTWSDRVEATKIGHGVGDRGYVGHKAAKMMKRALTIERRQDTAIAEKRALLKHIDYAPELRIGNLPYHRRILVEARELTLSYGDMPLFAPRTFAISTTERIALRGANGSGKTTLLKAIMGAMQPHSGILRIGSGLRISLVAQETAFLHGDLREYALAEGIDESLFKAILRKLDFLRSDFEKDMANFSQGEKKKVLLAASLSAPSHLYLWDEPLNFIDYYSREQILQLLCAYQPTMLFVEHDQFFCEQVATRYIDLG
ncbi:MAG: ABC-F type ribosomal protection protein [Symbiobacteriaceae bacterium]|nr:ABC-F type ribosomal protection protein [Symbiobacteriaceae bacterium]